MCLEQKSEEMLILLEFIHWLHKVQCHRYSIASLWSSVHSEPAESTISVFANSAVSARLYHLISQKQKETTGKWPTTVKMICKAITFPSNSKGKWKWTLIARLLIGHYTIDDFKTKFTDINVITSFAKILDPPSNMYAPLPKDLQRNLIHQAMYPFQRTRNKAIWIPKRRCSERNSQFQSLYSSRT